ncbi:MAG: methyltransferase domain-containing protein, partial [Betaproteobacteria bacterium]|nr:methyltransferase domain-containing protein [Betaproteobacteria bacterium]
MKMINALDDFKAVHTPGGAVAQIEGFGILLRCLYPATPHIAHNLWQGLGYASVLGDILEHLKDPWAMLSRLAACLSPDGVLLACIPNVGHWTVIDGLLRGDFSYRDQGLLDRTHLRFFTASSMLELFQRAGLAASKMRAREIVVNKEGFEAFVESMKPWIASAAEDLAVVRQRWLSLQYVIRAVPSARLGISQLPGAKAPQEAKAIPGAEAIRGGSVFSQVKENCRTVNQYCRSIGVERTKMWTVVQKTNI